MKKKRIIVAYGGLMKRRRNHYLMNNQTFLGETYVYGILQIDGSNRYLFDPTVRDKKGKDGFLYDAEGYEVDEDAYQRIL